MSKPIKLNFFFETESNWSTDTLQSEIDKEMNPNHNPPGEKENPPRKNPQKKFRIRNNKKIKIQRQKAIAEGRLQPTQQGHPDEGKIKELLGRTGYNLDVTTGQRKYGGPPPTTVCHADTPPSDAEVFIGKIPRDMFEGKISSILTVTSEILKLKTNWSHCLKNVVKFGISGS